MTTMTRPRKNRIYRKPLRMDYKALIIARQQEAFSQFNAIKHKYLAMRRDLRILREKYKEAEATWLTLARLESHAEQSEEAEADAEINAKVSSSIGYLLHRNPEGLTLAQLHEMMGVVKRSTISATLYNMKERGEVEHNRATGQYRPVRREAISGPNTNRAVQAAHPR